MMRSAGGARGLGLLRALRRVRGGHVTVHELEGFSDASEAFPRELVPSLHELFVYGQVRLGAQLGSEPHRVVTTTAGEELLAELELDDR